jgi:hypothetical protein
MASLDGYAVMPNAVPQELTQRAVDAIKEGLAIKAMREKFTEFDSRLPVCQAIRDEFMKVSHNRKLKFRILIHLGRGISALL